MYESKIFKITSFGEFNNAEYLKPNKLELVSGCRVYSSCFCYYLFISRKIRQRSRDHEKELPFKLINQSYKPAVFVNTSNGL